MILRNISAAIGAVLVSACCGLCDEPKANPKLTPEKAMAEAMTRWNKFAQDAKIGTFTFIWEEDRFPHPTFKGGSAEAYGIFARILVKFLDEKGNFEFLAENNLFTTPLQYGGKKIDDWTFAKLVSKFAEPKAHGDHDDATRKALKAFADKIAEQAKKDKP